MIIVKRIFVILQRLCRRGVVQLASILAWGASGRPFESGHSDNLKKPEKVTTFSGFAV